MFFTLWKNLLNSSSILCYLHLCWWYFTAHYILWNYMTNSVSPVPLTDRESMANMKMVLICTQWWAIYTECISTALLKSQDSLLVERRNRDRKVVSSNPGRSGGRIFFSRVSCVCWLLFGVHSNPLVTAVACKRPKPFCQKCRWQVIHKQAYTLDPMKLEWADYATVQAWCGNLFGRTSNAISKRTLDHCPLSSLSHCGLILA